MKVIKGHWNGEYDTIVIDDNMELEKEIAICIEEVRSNPNIVYLFYPKDVLNAGCPVDENVSREDYLSNPVRYGVACYYQNWSGKVMFE